MWRSSVLLRAIRASEMGSQVPSLPAQIARRQRRQREGKAADANRSVCC